MKKWMNNIKCKDCVHFNQDNLEGYGNGFCWKRGVPTIREYNCGHGITELQDGKSKWKKILSKLLKKLLR